MKNCSRKILITGGNGQLAQALQHQARSNEYELFFYAKHDLNICQPEMIEKLIDSVKPDVIVNTAAYTAVDKAEQETEFAMQINHHGADNLARACAKHQLPIIHVSTDYIFDGNKGSAYNEEDHANPINLYGESKWLGEQAVRASCPQHHILRVSGVFSEYGNNFLKTMVRLASEKSELRVVGDQTTCPTYAGHIADAIYSLIDANSHWGTYHYCSKPVVSWYEFAVAIINAARLEKELTVKNINRITTAEYPTPAKRPAYSVLDCSKIANTFGIQQPEWSTGIQLSLQGGSRINATRFPG